MLVACTYWQYAKKSVELDLYQSIQFIQQLAQQQPTHEFIFLTNQPFSNDIIWAENIQIHHINSNLKLGKKLIEAVQFKKLIQLFQPKAIIHCNQLLPLKTLVPQIIFLQHLPIKKEITALLKVQKIVVCNQDLGQRLVENFNIDNNKVECIELIPVKDFKPLVDEETSLVKDAYATSREYFLYLITQDSLDEFMNVLKAFSLFKKWQKSNMKLLVLNRFSEFSSIEKEKLNTYKFKDDIVLIENVQDQQYAKILASAYATIYLSNQSQYHLPWLEILQVNQPLITTETDAIKQIVQDCSIFVKNNDVDDLASQMQKVYKDENLRSKLIERANEISNLYAQSNSVAIFWQTIAKATSE